MQDIIEQSYTGFAVVEKGGNDSIYRAAIVYNYSPTDELACTRACIYRSSVYRMLVSIEAWRLLTV
jgi:hypothetical protein